MGAGRGRGGVLIGVVGMVRVISDAANQVVGIRWACREYSSMLVA